MENVPPAAPEERFEDLPAITKELFEACANLNKSQPLAPIAKLIAEGADPSSSCSMFNLLEGDIIRNVIRLPITPLGLACNRGDLDLAKLLTHAGESDDRAIYHATEFYAYALNEKYLETMTIDDQDDDPEGQTGGAGFHDGTRRRQRWSSLQDPHVDGLRSTTRSVPVAWPWPGPCWTTGLALRTARTRLSRKSATDGTMAGLLLENDADMDDCDAFGTPLPELVVRQGDGEIAELLLEHQMEYLPNYDDE
jgi:ankyrin repeat protein